MTPCQKINRLSNCEFNSTKLRTPLFYRQRTFTASRTPSYSFIYVTQVIKSIFDSASCSVTLWSASLLFTDDVGDQLRHFYPDVCQVPSAITNPQASHHMAALHFVIEGEFTRCRLHQVNNLSLAIKGVLI